MTERSVFKVNAKNQLGLDFDRTRSKLLSLALSKPELYYELRDDIITKITEDSVEAAYNSYFYLLTKGLSGDGREQLLKWPATTPESILRGVTDRAFQPNLPEAMVNHFALKVAASVKEIAEEAVEEILPMQAEELAKSRSKSILNEKNNIKM